MGKKKALSLKILSSVRRQDRCKLIRTCEKFTYVYVMMKLLKMTDVS